MGYPGDSDIAIDDISLLDGSADSTTGLLGKCGKENHSDIILVICIFRVESLGEGVH